jgi:hypothetical protein
MQKNTSVLIVALSILTNLPAATLAAEPVQMSAQTTWTNVTPRGGDLVNEMSCGNYGSITIVVDPARPSNVFTQFNCQGGWKSVDLASRGQARSIPGMAEPRSTEREGSPLREARMDNPRSFILPAFAAPGRASENQRMGA